MMQLEINQEALPVYEALASNVRIKIIQLLARNKMNVKEIAQELGLSSAIVTMHIKKLEEAKIIKTERVGQRKISSLRVDHIDINFPEKSLMHSIREKRQFQLVIIQIIRLNPLVD